MNSLAHKTLILSIAFLFVLTPASQAGAYIQFGYGHHGGNYGYGHHGYGYGYGYPLYYGLHSYDGLHEYGYHYDGHHYGSYAYPYYGYNDREPYASDDGYTSSSLPNHGYAGSSIHANGHGWVLLGNNQASAALVDFSRQAQASPTKGDPKVGYALASADLGHLNKGVWAMRRALRIDPHALHYISLDKHLDAKVAYMIVQYEKKLAYSPRDADAAFMLASLHYLRRDMNAARTNIDQAMLIQHDSPSTNNLKNLIDHVDAG